MLVKKYKIYIKQINTDLDNITTKLNYNTTSINKLINIVINSIYIIPNFKPDTYVEVPFDGFFVMAFYTYINGRHYNANWGLLNDCGLALRSRSGNTKYNNGAYPLTIRVNSEFSGPLIMSLSVTKNDAVAFSNWGWVYHNYYGNHMYTYGKLFVNGWPVFTRRKKLMFGDKLFELTSGFNALYGEYYGTMPNIKFV